MSKAYRLCWELEVVEMSGLAKQFSRLLAIRCIPNGVRQILPVQALHTTNVLDKNWNTANTGPRKWLQYNKVVHPPQEPHEEPRNAVSK